MFNFEKLEVWHLAIGYADEIYNVTECFPDRERFGLTNQLRRAAVSISSNIAEGSGRSSNREYARFVEIAYGSLMETVSQLHISHRRGFIDQKSFDELSARSARIARMLSGLRASISSGNSQSVSAQSAQPSPYDAQPSTLNSHPSTKK